LAVSFLGVAHFLVAPVQAGWALKMPSFSSPIELPAAPKLSLPKLPHIGIHVPSAPKLSSVAHLGAQVSSDIKHLDKIVDTAGGQVLSGAKHLGGQVGKLGKSAMPWPVREGDKLWPTPLGDKMLHVAADAIEATRANGKQLYKNVKNLKPSSGGIDILRPKFDPLPQYNPFSRLKPTPDELAKKAGQGLQSHYEKRVKDLHRLGDNMAHAFDKKKPKKSGSGNKEKQTSPNGPPPVAPGQVVLQTESDPNVKAEPLPPEDKNKVKTVPIKTPDPRPGDVAVETGLSLRQQSLTLKKSPSKTPGTQKVPSKQPLKAGSTAEKTSVALSKANPPATQLKVPTQALGLAQKGYTVWADKYGKWHADKNPSLNAADYLTKVMPGGRQVTGTAKRSSFSDLEMAKLRDKMAKRN